MKDYISKPSESFVASRNMPSLRLPFFEIEDELDTYNQYAKLTRIWMLRPQASTFMLAIT